VIKSAIYETRRVLPGFRIDGDYVQYQYGTGTYVSRVKRRRGLGLGSLGLLSRTTYRYSTYRCANEPIVVVKYIRLFHTELYDRKPSRLLGTGAESIYGS
jgi:hypothetical protein